MHPSWGRAMVAGVLAAACAAACTAKPSPGEGAAASEAPTQPAPSPSEAAPAGARVLSEVEPSVVAVFAGATEASGIVYAASGTIVTNAHVVGAAKTVQVGFADGSRSPGKVVAVDAVGDLAVVQVERANLEPAQLATALPPPGTPVLVVSSPLGADGQLSAGVLAGVARTVPAAAKAGRALVELVRMDVGVGAGQSGGAVVGMDGTVVGLLDAFPGTSAAYAIPAATVGTTVTQLLADGKAHHAYLGASVASLTLALSQALDLGVHEGVMVREMTAKSPAANAGLKVGDIVTAVNGQSVRSAEEFLGALRTLAPTDVVRFEIHRGGAGQTISVTLAELRR